MKVNDPNSTSLGAAAAARALQTGRPEVPARGNPNTGAAPSGPSDDVRLSELVRSLRSLAADSPERQAKLEQLTRAYASGTYTVDAQATAAAILNDAVKE
ncbi:MAG TPA: flagellar biosynthesis anti-sigma factor FlgM [Bryobacteraceae bacterium]|nr:flagellar biosynthesis anti-sigma factor FlgM [Bryobacteraceae bacterium]